MAVLGAAALWAIIGVFTTELGRRGHRAPSVAFWRSLGGGVCFVAHAVATRRRFRVERARRPALAAFTVIGVSVFYLALPAAVGVVPEPATAAQVLDLLQTQVRQEGAACLLVTHSAAAAAAADRVVTLKPQGIEG